MFLGDKIEKSVIAVPATFNEAQRQAMKEAGEIAGLDVVWFLDSTSATALAYSWQRKEIEKTIAIYDFGGGSFSISTFEVGEGVVEQKAQDGDYFVGGDDVDHRIMKYLISEFLIDTGIDIARNIAALYRLRMAAEEVKRELSTKIEADVKIPYIKSDMRCGEDLSVSVSRNVLELLVDDLVKKTLESCGRTIKEESEVDEVVLAGGMTKMPCVQRTVKDFFGSGPRKRELASEAVAVGASVLGAVLAGDIKDILLLVGIPYSMGIEYPEGKYMKMISKNTIVPTKRTEILSVSPQNPLPERLRIYQGENKNIIGNKLVGEYDIKNILAGQLKEFRISTTFDIYANSILHVKLKNEDLGAESSFTVVGRTDLDDDELKRVLAEEQSEK